MTYDVGIHLDIEESVYHALPGLSSTGAKTILESPAKFRYGQQHPTPAKKEFDIGTAAHSKVLGVGAPMAVIPDDLLASNGATSTKAAKEFIAAARAEGKTPVKAAEAEAVDAMAEAVLAHPDARALLEAPGHSEVSAIGRMGASWFDGAAEHGTEVTIRGRFDRMLTAGPIVDLKTTRTAHPAAIERYAAGMGWHVQAALYLRLSAQLRDPIQRDVFVHICVEKDPPYLTAVYRLTTEALAAGDDLVLRAVNTYGRCLVTDTWPGYPSGLLPLDLPRWHSTTDHIEFEELVA